MLNYEYRKAIEAMRRDGYALLIFTPEELSGVDPKRVERALRNVFDQIQALENYHVHPNNTH